MANSIDNRMSRLCGRLMSVAQTARDSAEYILEEMEYVAEANPEREDVRACIDEVKAKIKSGEAENWATANHWSEHFDGISDTEEDDDTTSTKKEGADD